MDGPIVVIKDPRTEKNRVIDPGHIGRQIMSFRQLEAQHVIKVNGRVVCFLLGETVQLLCLSICKLRLNFGYVSYVSQKCVVTFYQTIC